MSDVHVAGVGLCECINSFRTTMRKARIEQNMIVFKLLSEPRIIRQMNKRIYKATMHWIREVNWIITNRIVHKIDGCVWPRKKLPKEIVDYFVPAN